MSFRRMGAISLRYFYLMQESPARVLQLFAWVAIDMILWGFITRYLNTVSQPGMNFVPTLLGAVLLWDFFSRVMHGISLTFFEDVWSRNFLNLFASPLTIPEYLCGLILSAIGSSFAALLAMLAMASGIFGLRFLGMGFAAVGFLLVLFLFGIAVGIAGITVVLRYGPSAEWFIWPIPAMLSPVSGVFYPVATLPSWMQMISRIVPASYVFEGLRDVVAGRNASFSLLAIGGALALVYVFFAGVFFFSTYRHAVKSGLIARYSAESV
jgi:ABC-2 type transport system permease protein